jgi:hypothetical protein
MISNGLKELRTELYENTTDYKDELINLAHLRFFCSDEEMFLTTTNGSNLRYNFKMNQAEPNNPRTVHAHKQFCKYVKVPYAFFKKNRPNMRNEIVQTWQDSLQMEGKNELKIFRMRKGREHDTIRAILPDTFTCFNHYEIIDALTKETGLDLDLEVYSGETRDEPVFHVRILVGEEFEVQGKKLRMGISILASEIGSSDLIVEAVVHSVDDGIGYLISYGGESFFRTTYSGIQPNELRDILHGIPDRIADEK